MKNKLIFQHLPKCGGTTFNSILMQNYTKEETFSIKVVDSIKLNTNQFISLPDSEKEQINLLKGHMEFGLHENFVSKADYITFIRHPIERIVSFYYYVKRRPNHGLFKTNDFTNETTLHEFVTKTKRGDINNGQIRFISGIDDTEEKMLEKAIYNIENHFSHVGLLERFDESILLLQKMYSWKRPYYEVSNETQNRKSVDNIKPETIQAIKELNNGDIILYNKMSKLFEELIVKEGITKLKLQKFRREMKYNHLKKRNLEKFEKLYKKIKRRVS